MFSTETRLFLSATDFSSLFHGLIRVRKCSTSDFDCLILPVQRLCKRCE